MIYVRSKTHPPQKSGPTCIIEENRLFHAITVGDPIVNIAIVLHIYQNIIKYHDFSTKLDVDHRTINIFG